MEKIRPFKDLSVSTQTVICYSNCKFILDNIFKNLPVIENNVNTLKTLNGPVQGGIYQLKCAGKTRGIPSKKGVFRNQITAAIFIDNKLITVKIFPTGKFHMTGCKHLAHQQGAMRELFKHIRSIHTAEAPTIVAPDTIEIILEVVMVNVDFDINYNIALDKLDLLLQTEKSDGFYSIFETPVNTSVNVKYEYTDPDVKTYQRMIITGPADAQVVTLDTTTDCPLSKKREKRTHTFLVFSSNKVIQTGRFYESEMETIYKKFNQLLHTNKSFLELSLANRKFDINGLKGLSGNLTLNN